LILFQIEEYSGSWLQALLPAMEGLGKGLMFLGHFDAGARRFPFLENLEPWGRVNFLQAFVF